MAESQQSLSSSLVASSSSTFGNLLSENYDYAYNTLRHVFKYLKPMALFCAYHVCSTWRNVIELEKLKIPKIPLYSCLGHSTYLEESFGTNVEGLIVYFDQDLETGITEPVFEVLRKQPQIRKLTLNFQSNRFVGLLAPAALPQIEEVKIYAFVEPDQNLQTSPFLTPFPNLTSLILEIVGGNRLLLDGFEECTTLRHLSLSINSDNCICSWGPITSLRSLETLILDGPVVEKWMSDREFGVRVVENLSNLTHLGLPNINELSAVIFFKCLKRLEKLSFYGCAIPFLTEKLFKRISCFENIKHIFIFVTLPASLVYRSTFYSSILASLCEMKKLKSLTWICQDYNRTTGFPKPLRLTWYDPTSPQRVELLAFKDIVPFLRRSLPYLKDIYIEAVPSEDIPERYIDLRTEQHCFKCKHLTSRSF